MSNLRKCDDGQNGIPVTLGQRKGIMLTLLILCIGFSALASFYVYEHPYMRMALADVTLCQAYHIKTQNDFEVEWLRDQAQSMPDFNSPKLGKKLASDYWIAQGPITCSRTILHKVNQILASSWSYPRYFVSRGRFHPRYAFRLVGQSGSIVVLIDFSRGQNEIERFDSGGMLMDRDFIQGNAWLSLVKEAMPNAIHNVP